jgi:AraC-like DNA-binding protein
VTNQVDEVSAQALRNEPRSVSLYVRDLRLERCRRDLLDPRLPDRSISTVAFRWGFGDLSGFNRAFRDAFGITTSRWTDSQPERSLSAVHRNEIEG